MTTSDTADCEVQIAGTWMLLSVAEAHLAHRDADKRCPACHGRVRTQGVYGVLKDVKMAHYRGHDGCPRIPLRYDGTPKPHPHALI